MQIDSQIINKYITRQVFVFNINIKFYYTNIYNKFQNKIQIYNVFNDYRR